MRLKDILQPSIFGVFDGATSVIGIILTLTGHAEQVIPTSLGLASAGAVGMAAGSYLSDDSKTGLTASVSIGVATGLGTMLPVLPYLFTSGISAIIASFIVLIIIGAMISVARVKFGAHSWARAFIQTYAVLILVCAAVGVCTLATGSGAN